MYPQKASNPIQGLDRCALTMGAISGPHCQIRAPFDTILLVMDLHVGKKHSGKADQSTLASGGSEHA